PRHQPAVDSRLVSRTGLNQPVRHRSFPFGELPVEQFPVKFYRSFGVFGVYLEMDDSRHSNGLLPLIITTPSLGFYRNCLVALISLQIRSCHRNFPSSLPKQHPPDSVAHVSFCPLEALTRR